MATLFLVRHAQASFDAAADVALSPLGQRQSVQLGRHFAARQQRFDLVLSGTRHRHTQTLAGVSEGMGTTLKAQTCPGLDGYDSQKLMATVHPEPLPDANPAGLFGQQARLLRQVLLQWMLGRDQPVGFPPWADFRQGVMEVLAQVQASGADNVLLVSSGGPIACAIGQVLATPPAATVELNLRLRHTSVTEFAFDPGHLALQTYNTLPHLDSIEFDSWITHG